MKLGTWLLAVTLATTYFQTTHAQGTHSSPAPETTTTVYLANVAELNDANEILVALRNTLDPRSKAFLVASRNAIVLQAQPDQVLLAQKIIKDLDLPHKSFRLTYTLAEVDAGKHVHQQRFSVIIANNTRASFKQGSRIPAASILDGSGKNIQVFYSDIGLSFEATLLGSGNGGSLQYKIQQSSVSDEKSAFGATNPVILQAALEGSSFLKFGKPLLLGSFDVPNTTRHLDVEVIAETITQ